MTNDVPKIRFKGYSEAWEQRKLGELGKATGGTPIESEFSEDGIYKVISIGSYSENSVYYDQGIRAIDSKKTNKRVLNNGDITMILNDKTASGNIIGRVLLIEESGVYVYNQRTERIEINSEIYDSLFIYEMLNAPEIRDKIIKQSQGNTQIYVNWSTIALTEYFIPSIEEQRLVGKYLNELDHLITLHQRKVKLLKQLKQAYLQQMFPKKDKKFPPLRFANFSEEWEQRKLGEIAKFINGRAYSQPELLSSGKYKILRVGNFYTNDFWYYSDLELEDKYYANDEDLLYTWSAAFGPHIWHGERVIYHYHIWKVELTPRLDKRFAMQLFEYDKAQFTSDKNGSTMVHITKASMENKNVVITSVPEQMRIGKYLDNLDNLITLYQKKLDNLKVIKTAYLKSMFI